MSGPPVVRPVVPAFAAETAARARPMFWGPPALPWVPSTRGPCMARFPIRFVAVGFAAATAAGDILMI